MIDKEALAKIKKEGWNYKCCDGNPNCANNKTKKFIDHLQHLARTNTTKFRRVLWGYIEDVETDRDFNKMRVKEILAHFRP